MTIAMTQIKLNCPGCGNYLWLAKRTAYNLTTKAWDEQETTAYCEKCEPHKHIALLKSSDKITPLHPEKKSE